MKEKILKLTDVNGTTKHVVFASHISHISCHSKEMSGTSFIRFNGSKEAIGVDKTIDELVAMLSDNVVTDTLTAEDFVNKYRSVFPLLDQLNVLFPLLPAEKLILSNLFLEYAKQLKESAVNSR